MRFLVLSLLLLINSCGAQQAAVGDAVSRQQALAENDVWQAAKLRGVAFRAIGQEPGWLLEITNGREILVLTSYGEERKSFPYVEPEEDKAARRTVFRLDPNTSLLIEGQPCTDTMSGESFQSTVTLMLGEQTLRGCGRALF